MIARPKMSQNERKTTEIRASKVGNFSPFSCPGQANATVARLRAAGDETWEVAVAMTVQATAQADALCDQFECAGIRRVRIPMVMRASRYHPYGRHPRVFKIRTMRFSPFRFTLFLDNDANVATPRSFGVLTSAFREMRAVNATIATFREGHPAGSRYVAEDEVPGGCPPGRLSAVGDELDVRALPFARRRLDNVRHRVID